MVVIRSLQVTGLVLAGGAGSRMGGLDKGLLPWRETTLAGHALVRLGPQVGSLAVSANRHLPAYEALGLPVWPDQPPGASGQRDSTYDGPLAGMLSGLMHCRTPWLVTVPCDCPFFPDDLVARLLQAATEQRTPAAIATAPDADNQGEHLRQPVFCLLSSSLGPDLAAYLTKGGRKIWHWLHPLGCAMAQFTEARAFININTPEDLARMAPSPEGHLHEPR